MKNENDMFKDFMAFLGNILADDDIVLLYDEAVIRVYMAEKLNEYIVTYIDNHKLELSDNTSVADIVKHCMSKIEYIKCN